MKHPSAYRAPYAQRLADTCRAAAIVAPKEDPYPELARTSRTSRALVAAVKGDAPALTAHLLTAARTLTAEIPPDPLGRAVAEDAHIALNRLAGMIRSNDPDPADA